MGLLSRSSIEVGDAAPDFSLPSDGGGALRLSDLLKSGPVVLFFYPKNNTTVCTKEACAFRDAHEVFAQAGVQVLGISHDSVGSHDRFRAKHNLPYNLLSDSDSAVHKLYGVRAGVSLPMIGMATNDRITFVIDGDGTVRHIHAGLLQAQEHVDEALRVVEALVADAPAT